MKNFINVKKSIFILLIIVLSNSCKNYQNPDKSQIKRFDLPDLPKISDIKLSDLGFDEIKYIPLETSVQSVLNHFDIKTVTDRFIADDSLFIIKQFNTILKFRNDGSFITRIGMEGKGPEEFMIAHDIDFSQKNHKLYLVSSWQKKFNVYSETGEYERTFDVPFYAPVQFRVDEDKILCYLENLQGNIENSFVLIDTMGKVVKSFPNKFPFVPKNKGGIGVGRENLFYSFNNHLYKKEVYSDTIFCFGNMEFKPHLIISAGTKLLTPNARAQFDLAYLSENFIRPLNLLEFGDYIYYEYTNKFKLGTQNTTYAFIGSKTKDFISFIDAEYGLINDLDGGPNVTPKTIKLDNELISWIDANKLKNLVASDDFKNSKPKYPDKKKELEILANNLKETDNPVLIIVRSSN